MQKEWILKTVYHVRFHIRFRLSAMRKDQLTAAVIQVISKCLWGGWNWQKWYKEIASQFACCPANREYSRKKSQIEKKRIMLYNMQEKTLVVWWMKSVLNLSWWRSLLYRNQPIDMQKNQWTWFLYDRNFCHERVNALLLACIHWDIFLYNDKIIDICASRYKRGCF